MFSEPSLRDWKRISVAVTIIALILIPSGGIVPRAFAETEIPSQPAARVTVVNPTVTLREWNVPTTGAGPWGIGVDPTGKIWFTENVTNKLGMFDPTNNKFYEWSIPGGGNPKYLFLKQVSISGSTSTRVYFTEYSSDKIAYFDNNTNAQNRFTEWALPTGSSKPVGIYVDADNNIWFTESGRDVIGRLKPDSNELTEWTLPGATATPGSPLLTPWSLHVQVVPTFSGTNRFVWFTQLGNDKIGRLEANSNRLTLFDLRASPLTGIPYGPMDIKVDSASNAIFSNAIGNRISILRNDSIYREYNIPTANSRPTSAWLDSTRNLIWFPEYNGGNIGNVNVTFSIPTQGILQQVVCTIKTGTSPLCSTFFSNGGDINTQVLGAPSVSQPSPSVNTQAPNPDSTLTIRNQINGVTEYALPTTTLGPNIVTLDQSGNVWFTESDTAANKIARVEIIIPYDFQVTVSPSTRNVTQGQSAIYSVALSLVSGTSVSTQLSVNTPTDLSANFNPQSGTPPFTSTLTIGTTTSTPGGTYSLTVTATGGGVTRTYPISVTVQTVQLPGFDFSMSVVGSNTASISQGGTASYALLISLTSGTSQSVTLSATGFPSGATHQFTTSSGLPSFSSTLNVQADLNSPAGSYPITITGNGGGKTHSAQVTLQIEALPRDFDVTASPSTVQVVQASQKSVTLTVQSVGVFEGTVGFAGTITPSSSMVVTFTPNPVILSPGGTASSQMQIFVPRDVPRGDYTVLITAPGGDKIKEVTVKVSVTGCLIATATYGSEVTPEVEFLRDFRDLQIMETFAGSNFMTVFNAWYYSFSPAVAQYEYQHPALRTVMKLLLYPLIGVLHVSSGSYSVLAFEPELAALAAGTVASSLIGIVYLALPLSGALWLVRRRMPKDAEKKMAKGLTALFAALVVGFVISEIMALPVAMMVVSVAIVLTALTMGSLLPAFVIVRYTKRRF